MLDRLRTHLWWSLLTPCIPPGSFLFLFLPHLRLLQLLQSHGDCVQVGEQQGGGPTPHPLPAITRGWGEHPASQGEVLSSLAPAAESPGDAEQLCRAFGLRLRSCQGSEPTPASHEASLCPPTLCLALGG